MSTKFKFDIESRILFVKRFGSIKPGELTDEMQQITSHSDYKGIDRLLSDLTESDLTAISTEELERHAELCRSKFKNLSAVALLAPEDLAFGVSRMFEVLSSLENVEVFRIKEDALDWLNINEIPDEII